MRVAPCFAENVSGIVVSRYEVEGHQLRGDRFTDSVKRQHDMPLVQLCVRNATAVHNRFVVTESSGWSFHGNSEVSKRDSHRDVLVGHNSRRNKLRTVCGRFNGVLLLTVPIDKRLIEPVLRCRH